MTSPTLAVVGTIDGGSTPIVAELTAACFAKVSAVVLTTDYSILHPPGMPSRPSMTGTDTADLDYPRTIASGTTLTLFAPEAQALISAGAATEA